MMNSILEFARFASQTEYDDIPEEVTTFVKNLLLDTFGCGIAGVTSDKGKWAIDFARRCYGNSTEAGVLGYGERFSMMGAAFVNAELINGLDYEAAGLHLPPYVIPPVMVYGETKHRDGKLVITATAIGLEIGTRIAQGLIGKKDAGSAISPVFGPSSSVFGAAAASAKMKRMSEQQAAQSMGLAGVLSPVPSQASMHRDLPVNSGKYLMAGWAAQTGITAVELICSGHRGNLQVLDSDYGYWRFTGCDHWDQNKALEGLGEKWRFLTSTPYKNFPCCGMMHGGLECLADVLKENSIRPEEIERITVLLDPTSAEPMFQNSNLENQIDAQFSVRYNMALIALGIQPGIEWGSHQLIHNPVVSHMMKKITTGVHPDCAAMQEKDPRARIVSAEVVTDHGTFKKELPFIKGTVTAGSLQEISEKRREDKFRKNASLILTEEQVEQAIQIIKNLEEQSSFAEVMNILHV